MCDLLAESCAIPLLCIQVELPDQSKQADRHHFLLQITAEWRSGIRTNAKQLLPKSNSKCVFRLGYNTTIY